MPKHLYHCANPHHHHDFTAEQIPEDGFCNKTVLSCCHKEHRVKGKHAGKACGADTSVGSCPELLQSHLCGAKIELHVKPVAHHVPQWLHCSKNSRHRLRAEEVSSTTRCYCGGRFR